MRKDTPKGNETMKKQGQQKKEYKERGSASISRRVSSGAMLVALAMIFSYVEGDPDQPRGTGDQIRCSIW